MLRKNGTYELGVVVEMDQCSCLNYLRNVEVEQPQASERTLLRVSLFFTVSGEIDSLLAQRQSERPEAAVGAAACRRPRDALQTAGDPSTSLRKFF